MLKHLTDISVAELAPEADEDGDEIGGFKLIFHFSPNPFFDQPTLVRTFSIFPIILIFSIRATEAPCKERFEIICEYLLYFTSPPDPFFDQPALVRCHPCSRTYTHNPAGYMMLSFWRSL